MQLFSIKTDPDKLNHFSLAAQKADKFFSFHPERKLYELFKQAAPLTENEKMLAIEYYYDIALSDHQKEQYVKIGLNKVQSMVLYSYSTEDYKKINPLLRLPKDQIPNEAIIYKVFLNSVMDRLPNFSGLVKRGLKIPDDQIGRYVEGAEVEFSSYTSTTKDLSFMRFENIHRMIIQSKTGKDISQFSANPNESEVLFKAGARFKVTKVLSKVNLNGRQAELEIHLEEI